MIRLILCLFVLVATTASAQLRAGAATANITPPLGSPIVGNWDSPPATHVHDELHARALVLENGITRLAIVVCDNVGIPREVVDVAKRRAHDRTGIPVANMLVSATHTHSGASAAEPEYGSFIASRIADAIVIAAGNLEPAELGHGVGREPREVFNRRWRMKPGSAELGNPFGGTDQVRMNPPPNHPDLIEPAGPTDPEIHFLSVRSTKDGRHVALLAAYSLHYVGGVPQGQISADYFAVFAKRIEQMLGADKQDFPFVAMLANGTSGDINNIDFRPASPPRKWRPYEKMTAVANAVAAEVFRNLQTIRYSSDIAIGAIQTEIPIGVRVPTNADVQWAESVLKQPSAKHVRSAVYARRTLEMRPLPAQMPLVLGAMRIGDVAIAALPAETFVEIGLEIRKRSPFPQTFTISLANGSYGYLPTEKQHELGGYETWRGTSRLEVQAATKIVDAIEKMMRDLQQAR